MCNHSWYYLDQSSQISSRVHQESCTRSEITRILRINTQQDRFTHNLTALNSLHLKDPHNVWISQSSHTQIFHSRTHFSRPSWSLVHGAHDTDSIGEKERKPRNHTHSKWWDEYYWKLNYTLDHVYSLSTNLTDLTNLQLHIISNIFWIITINVIQRSHDFIQWSRDGDQQPNVIEVSKQNLH